MSCYMACFGGNSTKIGYSGIFWPVICVSLVTVAFLVQNCSLIGEVAFLVSNSILIGYGFWVEILDGSCDLTN